MCRQGGFYIFHQAPSFNMQKFIGRHIIIKNWRFYLKWAINFSFLPLKKLTFYGCLRQACPCRAPHAKHTYAVHVHVMHAQVMPAHAVHCMPYGRINSDMPTVAIEPNRFNSGMLT
jgi:hypothetical protein